MHAQFLSDFEKIADNMNGIYGFPTWEKSVHDLLLAHYAELKAIFMAYCKIMATSSSTAYSSPVSETTRAVPRSASLTTL